MTFRAALFVIVVVIQGCAGTATYDPYVAAIERQLEHRAWQTREFDATDATQMMRAVIATLQDHHFRLTKVDTDAGFVTAYQLTTQTSLAEPGGRSDITVLLRTRNGGRVRVRAVMRTGVENPDDPVLYQHFFAALQQQLAVMRGLAPPATDPTLEGDAHDPDS